MPRFGPRIVVGLGLALITPGTHAAPAAPPNTFECEMVVRTTTHGIIDRAKITTKGDLVRLQKRTGAGLKILFLRNRQGTYHLNLHTNDGAKWPKEWAKDAERRLFTPGPQGDPKLFLKSVNAKRTGKATVNGRPAEVWTYSLPTKQGKSQVVRVYMDLKEKRPVKADLRMPVSPTKIDSVTIEYSRYRWGFPLPDSYFNLPAGAKVVDLGNPEKGTTVVPGGPKQPSKPAAVKRAAAPAGRTP